MSDISTQWVPLASSGDWFVSGRQLTSGSDLETAILISIFTDMISDEDDQLPTSDNNRRGWWGDFEQDIPIGSRLWLLERSKLTPQVAILAKQYITEAIQWMIDDGVVAKFDVTTEIKIPNQLSAKIVAHKQDGTNLSLFYSWAWSGLI